MKQKTVQMQKLAAKLVCLALLLPLRSCVAAPTVSITVKSAPQQVFQGFGVSNVPGTTYGNISSADKAVLNKLLWHDTRFKILRLWFEADKYAPSPGVKDSSNFVIDYINSGLITDALANGCTTLLLGPSAIPEYMGLGGLIKDNQITNYAALLAGFIQSLRNNYGVHIHATGILNEPGDRSIKIEDRQWSTMILALRAALNSRGLQDVKIVTPEDPSGDDHAVRRIEAIKESSSAWNILSGIATHSYNMAATKDIAKQIEGTNKEYWITEAGDNGPEFLGDGVRGASAASRFLSDMNHRVTHWIWFIGYEEADPNFKDDATRLIRYWTAPFRYEKLQKYFYLKQLSITFDRGAVFRKSVSSSESDMAWTYGKKPRITVASAKNPDGSWGIGISNYTSNTFLDPNSSEWDRTQGGYPAQTLDVTVYIEELAQSGNIKMQMRRSNSNINNAYVGTIVMRNGVVTIPNVRSVDLVTLRSIEPI